MTDARRREVERAYRHDQETGGRVPPWVEDDGPVYCSSCGQQFDPGDDDEELCAECRQGPEEEEE